MSRHQRMMCCGGITGMVSAALGALSVLGLGPHLGWVLGLWAGAVLSGLGDLARWGATAARRDGLPGRAGR